ncbi:MAG: SelL-related redox protein [Vicinamibacterales bacterium]
MGAVPLPIASPLRALADRAPVLVIVLRHFGCTFCREAIADVARSREAIREAGAAVAFVHGASVAEAEPWFRDPALADAVVISDPALEHYRAFGLGRTGAQSLIDPKIWARGAVCALSHGFGPQPADLMRQLPGVFLVHHGQVLAEYRHRSPADRPDYISLLKCLA